MLNGCYYSYAMNRNRRRILFLSLSEICGRRTNSEGLDAGETFCCFLGGPRERKGLFGKVLTGARVRREL